MGMDIVSQSPESRGDTRIGIEHVDRRVRPARFVEEGADRFVVPRKAVADDDPGPRPSEMLARARPGRTEIPWNGLLNEGRDDGRVAPDRRSAVVVLDELATVNGPRDRSVALEERHVSSSPNLLDVRVRGAAYRAVRACSSSRNAAPRSRKGGERRCPGNAFASRVRAGAMGGRRPTPDTNVEGTRTVS